MKALIVIMIVVLTISSLMDCLKEEIRHDPVYER